MERRVAETDCPSLSLLVPVWNERRQIAAFVAAFRRLSYSRRELILCAGGADGSLTEARRFAAPDIVVLEQLPGEGKQRALERCFRASRGDLLFLTDVDARPNDQAVLTTLGPILAGAVDVATGTRVPWPELRQVPLVAYQWALEVAGDARLPAEAKGLLGSNAALRRSAAVAAGCFAWEARTGTDYTLACRLRDVDIAIRFVPTSRMPVGLATTWRDYSRQRARWLRTLVLQGVRYKDWAVVRQGMTSMLMGLAFVLLPLTPGRPRRAARILWLCMLLGAWQRRIDYVRAAPDEVRAVLSPRRRPFLLLAAALDFATWARAAIEMLVPATRGRW